MHRVTDEQVDYILDDIKANGVTTEDLQYNLLDHICCIIENEMPEDEDFYQFYRNILPRFFKNELKELQEETENLLRFKHYYAMKKTLNITGIGAAVLTLAGAMFKTMHWPGAGIMFVLGAALFSLVFMPLMIVLKFKDDEKPTDKAVFAFGFLLALLCFMGFGFKIMHWPYANFLMTGSLTLFVFIYVPVYFITRRRDPEKRFNVTVNTALMMAAGGMLYGLINLSGSKSYQDSVEASYSFMHNHTARLEQSNAQMWKNVSSEEARNFQKISGELQNQLKETKAHLISISQHVPMEKARTMTVNDLKKPNSYLNIKDKFENGTGEYSLSSLKAKVKEYNDAVATYYPNDDSRQIAMDELQLERTVVSMVLYEISQMQWQLAHNENIFLSKYSRPGETGMVMARIQ